MSYTAKQDYVVHAAFCDELCYVEWQMEPEDGMCAEGRRLLDLASPPCVQHRERLCKTCSRG